MKLWQTAFLMLALLSPANATNESDAQLIRYARDVDVHTLDSKLSSQPLDRWLRSGPAHVDKTLWRASRDCDLRDRPQGFAEDDWPVCVRFTFMRGPIGGWGMLRVGTRKRGITGEPHLEYITVMAKTPA